MTTNLKTSTTKVDEIADGIYRISTPVDVVPGGFTFNQFLIEDNEPLLFNTFTIANIIITQHGVINS